MEKTIEISKKYFDSGYGCAESVLMAVAESRGIRSDLIPRIATGFCGGMAYTNGMCGAVSGAVLALNLVFGRNRLDEDKIDNYEAIQNLIRRFREKFGDINCQGLIGVDLGSEEGQKSFEINQMHNTCVEFVGESTRMVLELSQGSPLENTADLSP